MRTAEVMQACYNLLSASSLPDALSQEYGVPAIFQAGRVPRDDAGDARFFPYITYSVPSDVDFSTDGTLGGNAVVQIDVFDRSGSALALGVLLRTAALLTVRQAWGVAGFVSSERITSDVMPDPDGLTMRGMLRVRVLYMDP